VKTNFTHIESQWPDVYRELIRAEAYALKEPRFSAIQCRAALEKALYWIYDHDADLELPYQPSLHGMLTQEAFRNDLHPSLLHSLDMVRRVGNNGAHAKSVFKHESVASLKAMYMFSVYMVKYYGSSSLEILPFSEDHFKEGTSQQTVQAIKDQAVKLSEENERLKSALLEAEKEREHNQVLREAKEIERQAFKRQREERLQTYAQENVVPELLTEGETRSLLIDAALREAEWFLENPNVKEFEVKGMPEVTNPSGIGFVDYVLWGDNGLPVAVVEAKRSAESAEKGKHQAKLYANCLEQMFGQRPVLFYTNGYTHHIWDDAFYPSRKISGFYKKEELQQLIDRRSKRKNLNEQEINSEIAGRAYQYEAIKRMSESWCRKRNGELSGGSRKALLVMATGTGKTRTSIAAVDILLRAGWVKRVLFLADRNALLRQAKNAFNEHLPELSSIDLTKNKEDATTRLVFSTYKTMMNRIDGLLEKESRFYGVGHFDLIIVDEAHRSVYAKYKSIFEYFDALLLGLTATPVSYVDRNTYDLFGLEDRQPTFAYDLAKAVEEGFLVPPKAVQVPIKFMEEGIKYAELSEAEKEEYELKFGDPTSEEASGYISSTALNKWLFNENTVKKVLDYLMTHGQKVGGEHLGKTILFAANHKHALFIEEQFNKMFPEYRGEFLRVIDNYESKAEDLLEAFKDDKKDLWPRIAVSVDMMDTGVDAPQVVNLVFFKRTMSVTKFWQMIGRGTRLRPDLFGPGMDKEFFYVFDFCGNLEYFEAGEELVEPPVQFSLSKQIFIARLDLSQKLLQPQFKSEELQTMRKIQLDELHQLVTSLNENRFQVKQALEYVHKYKAREKWEDLSKVAMNEIITHLSDLEDTTKGGDELAKRFDLLMLQLMHYYLEDSSRKTSVISKLRTTANRLLYKLNIPAVREHEDRLRDMADTETWSSWNIMDLEEIRKEIRDLIKFLDRKKVEVVYTNFEDNVMLDSIGEYDLVKPSVELENYRDRIASFIRENKNNITIRKLQQRVQVTEKELHSLEEFIFDGINRGSREDFYKDTKESLGKFILKILGMDVQAARELFADFIKDKNLNAAQMHFVDQIISYLSKNGVIDKQLIFQSEPFTLMSDQGAFGLFDEAQVVELVGILDTLNARDASEAS
jgi:type I restriction enzyme R subunit